MEKYDCKTEATYCGKCCEKSGLCCYKPPCCKLPCWYRACKEPCCEFECCREGERTWKTISRCEKEKAKREIEVAVSVLCADWDPLNQDIMKQILLDMVKRTCKGKCEDFECQCTEKGCTCECPCICKGDAEDKCKETCSCGCKEPKESSICQCLTKGTDFIEHVKKLIKGFVGHCKDEVFKMIQVALDSFKRIKGMPLPPVGEGKWGKRLSKAVAKLTYKMHKKGFDQKENWEKIAEKFWTKRSDRRIKRMKKKAKKFSLKVLYYMTDGCDFLYQKVAGKTLTRALLKLWGMKWLHRMKHKEEKKEAKAEEAKRGPPFGMGMGMGMGIGMGRKFGGGFWKKGMKWCFKKHLIREGSKFAMEYLSANQENIRTCLSVAKDLVENYYKDQKAQTPAEARRKVLEKIVAEAVFKAGGEKKPNEFFADFTKRYLRGAVSTCDKKCVKCCRKMFKLALMLNGVKDQCVVHIASRWGAIMCCQAHGKIGCPKQACADFAAKWIKDFAPLVSEAVNTMHEAMKETAGEEGEKFCEYQKKKMGRRMVLKYLEMNCVEGKLDKEHFKSTMKECKEAMKKFGEKYAAKFEGPCFGGPCPKPEAGNK